MSEREREILINEFIVQHCNFIFGGSDNILNGKHLQFASRHPEISFARMAASASSEQYDNLVEFTGGWFNTSFVAGAVAATASKTCGGFINAFESPNSAWGHAMGWTLGYNWVKPDQQVHIITMDSYYNPSAEVLAATQLVEKFGCDVIGRHTDPNDVDTYIFGLGGSALSMSRYVDMSTFVGDSVFTSQVINFADYLGPTVEASFLSLLAGKKGPMHNFEAQEDGEIEISTQPIIEAGFDMKLSPITSAVDQDAATMMEQKAYEYLASNNPLCNTRWKANQELVTTGSSVCPVDTQVQAVSYLDLPNAKYYYSFQDAGAVCGGTAGGQFYQYEENLTVTCFPCPENTFRLGEENGRADTMCIPCLNGTVAPPGSSLCREFVEENLNQISPGVRGYGFAISAIIMLTSLGFMSWVHYNASWKKQPSWVIRASQPIFLHLLCCGTFVMGSAIIPLAYDDAIASDAGMNIACVSVPWLVCVGFTCSFAALYSKISRLNQLFKAAKSCKRVLVKEWDVLKPFFVLISLNVALLTLWTIIDPPQWQRILSSSTQNESYGTCWAGTTDTGKWSVARYFLASGIGLVNLAAVILANIQAYRGRSISDELSEGKYIGLAMASILQMLSIGVPLIFLVWDSPEPFFFVVSSIILTICMSLLLLIFVPKFLFMRSHSEEDLKKRMGMSIKQSVNAFSKKSDESPADAEDATTSLNTKKNVMAFSRGGSVDSDAEFYSQQEVDPYSQQEVDRFPNVHVPANSVDLESNNIISTAWDSTSTRTASTKKRITFAGDIVSDEIDEKTTDEEPSSSNEGNQDKLDEYILKVKKLEMFLVNHGYDPDNIDETREEASGHFSNKIE